MRPSRASLGPLLGLLFLALRPESVLAQADAPAPRAASDATITLTARAAGVGMGLIWGSGVLEFQGKSYPLRVDGIAVGAVGAASVTARGIVQGLQQADDVNGQYTAIGAGAAAGSGANRMRLRNAKGVVIEISAEGAGVQLGAGPRGVTLQIGEAGGAPASASFALPSTLGFGEAAFGPHLLQPTLNVQLAGFAEANAGFGGAWAAGPIERSDLSLQHSNEVGLNARLDLGAYGNLRGRVSGVFSLSGAGVDPGATSAPDFNTNSYSLEAAFLSWHSGKLFPGLGEDAVEVGYGNQNYQVFDGLIFWDGGADCGARGACWLSPRKAFREAGTFRMTLGGLLVEGYHLKLNDDPSTGTRLGGGRIEYVADDPLVGETKTGFAYFDIYESDEPSRDGLNGFYVYQEATPLRRVPDFHYTTSFVAETNSALAGNEKAYGWYVAPAYTVSQLPWSPQISYRFASFDKRFDPLFTGLSDWGTWAQGELLGEWVLSNQNLKSHMVRLKLAPSEVLTVNVLYYRFLLASLEQSFGAASTQVDRHGLADEVDVIFDLAPTNWWSITAGLTVAVPDDAFRQATGGNATWINGMLYTNFNF